MSAGQGTPVTNRSMIMRQFSDNSGIVIQSGAAAFAQETARVREASSNQQFNCLMSHVCTRLWLPQCANLATQSATDIPSH